jgi:SpoVK/Ycf46/Vps4 family AAA+-type ATPase
VIQLVQQIIGEGKSNYGLFATGRINGALIYGPTGTGKTHLARVLAKESKTTMLLATVAEIEGALTGQTEKAIKALFNLARMCSPSIVFIDEADALFQSRKGVDTNWERSRLSQFLIETDGLRKRDSEPFLILATNHPSSLDHAVFRRVPARIYMGLPLTEARERILHIYLRGEDVDPEVSMKALARETSRFSASDIRTLCVQAALVCQTELDDAGRSPGSRRRLGMSHFAEALRSCGSTVSESNLHDLGEFAREFDPSGLDTMYADRTPAGAQDAVCVVD